jgi:type I restriction-modification system DNA methylase subunit
VIERTQERIDQTGEVFTPPELVNEVLDRIPAEMWNDPNKTFIDNSCGDGNFLVSVIARKIAAGSSVQEALSTTYGVELMPDNAALARTRILQAAYDAAGLTEDYATWSRQYRGIVKRNIACADALTFDYWAPNLFD